jgi:hypothetical protein
MTKRIRDGPANYPSLIPVNPNHWRLTMKTTDKPAKNTRSMPIKVVKEYETKDGEKKSRFATIGWMREATNQDGKIAFYLDLDMFSSRFLVFRDDEAGNES